MPTSKLMELVRGSATIVLKSAGGHDSVVGYRLEPADVLRFNVTVAAVAASTMDALISVEELR